MTDYANQTPTTLKEVLAILMKRDRMSVDFLASELGMSRASAHDLITGRNKGTRPETLQKLATLFRVDLNYLYGLTNQIPPDLRDFIRDNPQVWDGIRTAKRHADERRAKEEAESEAYRRRIAATFQKKG
jgi:transcriptional regulator with XRE-family HTH domain